MCCFSLSSTYLSPPDFSESHLDSRFDQYMCQEASRRQRAARNLAQLFCTGRALQILSNISSVICHAKDVLRVDLVIGAKREHLPVRASALKLFECTRLLKTILTSIFPSNEKQEGGLAGRWDNLHLSRTFREDKCINCPSSVAHLLTLRIHLILG